MKKLIYLLVLVAVCLIAMIAAPSLVGDKGYVLIQMGNFVIETSVVALGIMLFVAACAWFIISTLVGRTVKFTRRSGSWFGSRSRRKQQRAFYRSIQALAEGDWDGATKAAEQTESGDFDGVNFLVAAQAAVARERQDTAERKLNEAAEFPHSALAARVTLARMALAGNEPDKALKELSNLDEKQRKSVPAIKLRVQALAESGQWAQLEQELGGYKKALGSDYAIWSKQIAQGRLAEVASKQGAIQLKLFWDELPRKQRNDVGYQAAYAEQLLAQGMHQEAQTVLLNWQKRGPVAELLPLFKSLRLPNPAPTVQALEKWIKADEQNAELYSVLGYVAYHAGDLTLADKALQKAMKLHPTQEGWLLLAELNEKANKHESAMAYYKQGLTDDTQA
ncbi:heme biosynthesis HemY N-terminal domain-containing protein [Alteromonas gilva]|uniref:Heme biosynthesis HemY N-terminal domain-containing protein n=1 Tax=Alteromonas gilva TaxID=2987522 RepID=A0ABT5L524_9ALTE|nr:heme biosynthesis HemY N-terminal domain-containing protein [Alteromonas gilva]MDC8831973.1 heme biosynthesis HemY N-terminal domain-containing protein [Alteromonas gilva]